jgi:hypothetical protein
MESREDSSDEDTQEKEPLQDRRMKRRKTAVASKSPLKEKSAKHKDGGPPSSAPPYAPGWTWQPAQWMPEKPSQPPPTWSGPQPPAFGAPWSESVAAPTQDSEDRASRRKRRQEYDVGNRDRSTEGKKANFVFVCEGGEVDAGCRGKNAWDEAIRDYTPRMLDMSCTTWSKQDPFAVRKLREALDNEFEYRGQPLSIVGFKTAIIKFMKSERSRLKVKWLKGLETCPDHINGTQWGRLKEYWDTPAQRLKALKMKSARQSVKASHVVGRKGKAGKEAAFVSPSLHCAHVIWF